MDIRLWISPDRDLASSFPLRGNPCRYNAQWRTQLSPVGWLMESTSNQGRTEWTEAERTYFCILKWVLNNLFNSKALLTFFSLESGSGISKEENASYPPECWLTLCVSWSIFRAPLSVLGAEMPDWLHFCKGDRSVFAGASALTYYQHRYIEK